MENRNPQKVKAAKRETQDEADKNKTKILIVSDHPVIQKELCQLFDREADLEICIDVDGQPREAIEKQPLDLAIVDISSEDTNVFKVAGTIKFKYLNIPIVLLSIDDEALYAKDTLGAEGERPLLNQQATERIVKAVRYTQSLLRSQISGFTLAVNIERSPRDDH